MRRIVLLLSAMLMASAGSAYADTPVVTTANLAFHSSFWVNLHHTLYGAAWSRRPDTGGRRLIPALPGPLSAQLSDAERAAWEKAVDYYASQLADRDLRMGRDMTAIKRALAEERLDAPAINAELRSVLQSAEPIYRTHYWSTHDRSNRAWIDDLASRFRQVEKDVIARYETLFLRKWFEAPVRIDVTWVGRAYTTLRPTHTVISAAEPNMTGWTGLEIALHEVAHELIEPLDDAIAKSLGDRRRAHGDLWHVVQFYLTGSAMQEILRARGIEYTPYLYSTGLFDRAWKRYRPHVEANWSAYLRGEIDHARAIEQTVAALPN